MKLRTKEPPHAFLPIIASHFGGGDIGIKAAIVFHKIAVSAFNNEDPSVELPFYDSWLGSTYKYFCGESQREADVFYIIQQLQVFGAIESVRKNGYYLIKITQIGFTILNLIMEKEEYCE